MKFLMITNGSTDQAPTQEAMEKLGVFSADLFARGIMIDTGAVQQAGAGTKVSYKNGKLTATDGPFAETKEMLAGYAIVEVSSKDEAIELSRQFYELMGGGEGEILQMFAGPPQE